MERLNSKVDVFHGLEGIKIIFNDIVATKKELVGWGATDRARELMPGFTNNYIRQREANNVRARQLAVEGQGVLETEYSKFKFIPKEYSSPATTLIYGNKVAIMMWFSKPVVCIRIANREIAEAYKHHFEFLWGTRLFSWEEILASQLVRKEIKDVFNNQIYNVVKRKSCYIIRLKNESGELIKRIIILPPNGSTAGEYSGLLADHDKFSPHPETLEAVATIKGGIAPGRLGYRKIDRAIKFSYFSKQEVDFTKDMPKVEYKSSHTPPFRVVRRSGSGFWHNLQNLSNEWVLLILEKKLIASSPLKIDKAMGDLKGDEKDKILDLFQKIKNQGDHIFENNSNPLENLLGIGTKYIILALISALNLREHANHEPCTAVALLLKMAKINKNLVLKECHDALRSNRAPAFYLNDIINKLARRDS
ncbi:MAG: hypothetical protein NT135_01690 [Candidatus Berkelbacteria bacterium]|nr:hypothetical protein [Candidatus Berkelbacteria bacterium]